MPKIPDFSKFDLQGIVNSVKSMISPDAANIKVPEGDFIGAKIVEVAKLIQNVSNLHSQAAKDLNQINDLLGTLYRELEAFRKQSLEKQQGEAAAASGTTTNVDQTKPTETKPTPQTETKTTENIAPSTESEKKSETENK